MLVARYPSQWMLVVQYLSHPIGGTVLFSVDGSGSVMIALFSVDGGGSVMTVSFSMDGSGKVSFSVDGYGSVFISSLAPVAKIDKII